MQRIWVVLIFGSMLMLSAGLLAGSPTSLAAAQPGSEQALAIIVNQSNPVENCSFDELRKIFLGERSHWPNGRRITLVMRKRSEQSFHPRRIHRQRPGLAENPGECDRSPQVRVQRAGSNRLRPRFGCRCIGENPAD